MLILTHVLIEEKVENNSLQAGHMRGRKVYGQNSFCGRVKGEGMKMICVIPKSAAYLK